MRVGGRFHRLSDPWRRPLRALSGLFAPVGGVTDKLRVARLRRRVVSAPLSTIMSNPERPTREALEADGFSPEMIERFFRPFLGGIFLDRDLETSSRMFEFVFKMFSEGEAALPAGGMSAIPAQLAAELPPGTIRPDARVVARDDHALTLATGEVVPAKAVVVATDGTAARELVPGLPEVAWRSTVCVYYAAPAAPVREPILLLNGDEPGPINNVCVLWSGGEEGHWRDRVTGVMSTGWSNSSYRRLRSPGSPSGARCRPMSARFDRPTRSRRRPGSCWPAIRRRFRWWRTTASTPGSWAC